MTTDQIIGTHFPAYLNQDTNAVWDNIKKTYQCGEKVSGHIVAKFQFGLLIDFGAPLPGLLLVTKIPDLTSGQMESDQKYQLNSEITATIEVFAERQNEIGLTQI